MLKQISQLFFQGLMALLPISLTIGFLWWLADSLETLLGGLLKEIIPRHLYEPGMGMALGIVVIFLFGLLVNAYITRSVFRILEGLLEQIPVVKTVYGSIKDILLFVSAGKEAEMGQVVAVTVADEMKCIGFVTRRNVAFEDDESLVAVYLPLSFQIGGMTIYVPESKCQPLDMSVEVAMRKVLTANMQSGEEVKVILDPKDVKKSSEAKNIQVDTKK